MSKAIMGPGRPTAARTRLNNDLIADLAETWRSHGPQILTKMAMRDPTSLARIAYGILPKDVMVSVEQRIPGNLSPEDWSLLQTVLDLIRSNIPAGTNAPPAEVFAVLEHALRVHYARPVSGDTVWDGVNGIGRLGHQPG